MPRPDESAARRERLLPLVARTFVEWGFRRTTTAALAERCGVPENTLFRLWKGKKGMFLASIDLVFQQSREAWERLLETPGRGTSAAERLLEYEASHHGEHGLYRIVFAGLSETDDPDIRAALRAMYRRFHEFITEQLVRHRGRDSDRNHPDPALTAWAILGLGTVANLGRELNLVRGSQRERLFRDIGGMLLGPSLQPRDASPRSRPRRRK